MEIRRELGVIMAERVMLKVSSAFHSRDCKACNWDREVFGPAIHKMASHDCHLYALHLVSVSEVNPPR